MPSLTVAFIYTCAVLRANGCNNLTLTPADLVEEFDEKFRCDLDHDVAINLARVVRFCVTRGCTHSTRIDQHVVRRMSAWRFPRSHLHSRQARRRRGCAECPERRGCARGGCDTTERRRGHGCGARRRPSRRRLDCGHEEEALERLCCAMCVTVLIFPHGPHTAVSPRLRGALERDDGLNRLLSAINKAPKFTQERTPRQPCPLRQARFFQRSARCRSDAWARLDYRARVCASALRCHCARATTGQARLFRARARSASLRRFVRC